MVLDTYLVKVEMAKAEINLYTLADRIGISYGQTANIVKNGTVKTETIGKIAHALGCAVEDIVKKEEA